MDPMQLSRFAILMLGTSLASGCGMFDSKPAPIPVTLTAAGDINPDASARPSPIRVRVYQLRSASAFQQSDYFALTDGKSDALGDTVVGSEEVMLSPGSTRTLSTPIDEGARYIGVVAGFRDIDRSQWRSVRQIDPGGVEAVDVSVAAHGVSVAVNQ
ncbi:type VI secretion system lipoprotein TssJ [Inquilinus sp. NPDC058860]|uniref:type VI secretion system lipoprotein TssJ n=1 Tax=Inquilinus sp. NPDC058860 TaxID=3346652 RepID=UPI003675ADFA